jgi:hypothetical protein
MLFAMQVNPVWQTFPRTYDEAVASNPENARRMANDPVLSGPLEIRTRTTALQTWHIEPDDTENEDEVKAAADVEWRIRQCPQLQQLMSWLLYNGVWCGRSGAQTYYTWKTKKDITGLIPTGFDPINGDKLVFGFGRNRGKVGVRVSPLANVSYEQIDMGMVHWFDDRDRQNLVCYQHFREDPDYWNGWKAGALEGVGLRDRLYWAWANKNMILGFMMDYMQWFARGLTIYYYDSGNASQLNELRDRIIEQKKSGLPVLLFPRTRDGSEPGYKPVERLEPGTASAQFILELVTQYYDTLFRRCILGQDLTTTAGGGGLGDGVATVHQTTFDGIVKYDSNNLQEVLTRDMVRVVYAYTYPGMQPGSWRFETEAPNVDQLIMSAQAYHEMGGQIDAEEFRDLLGLPIPKPGSATLSKQGSLDPTAVTQLPDNVPVVTPPDSQQPGPVVSQ